MVEGRPCGRGAAKKARGRVTSGSTLHPLRRGRVAARPLGRRRVAGGVRRPYDRGAARAGTAVRCCG